MASRGATTRTRGDTRKRMATPERISSRDQKSRLPNQIQAPASADHTVAASNVTSSRVHRVDCRVAGMGHRTVLRRARMLMCWPLFGKAERVIGESITPVAHITLP